jgi:2-oxoglutarate dehydrogenase E1 component
VLTPKSLLRHPRAVSPLSELTDGTFRTVLDDPRSLPPDEVQRVILCSGKIFYALEAGREERDWSGIAIVRLEQLYPFPRDEMATVLAGYPRATDVCWVQEEPANQGAWDAVQWRIETLLGGGRRLRYVGRKEAASPATGSYKVHRAEEDAIVDAALKRPPARRGRAPLPSAEIKGLGEPAATARG